MKTSAPYLIFSGRCREAMEFYCDSLSGEITIMTTCGESPIDFPPEASDLIFNSELRAEGICIKASDNPMSHGSEVSELRFAIFLMLSDSKEFHSIGRRLADGGQITMENEGSFLMLKDKFGYSWMLALDS